MNSIAPVAQKSSEHQPIVSDLRADTIEQARELRDRGFALVRVLPGEKQPTDLGWTTRSVEPEELSPPWMLGIQGGALSDGGLAGHSLVIVDLDSDAALQHADSHLPHTGMADGRKGKPRSHRYYLVPNASIPEEWQSKTRRARRDRDEGASGAGSATLHR
jgi:hypothetical protein